MQHSLETSARQEHDLMVMSKPGLLLLESQPHRLIELMQVNRLVAWDADLCTAKEKAAEGSCSVEDMGSVARWIFSVDVRDALHTCQCVDY